MAKGVELATGYISLVAETGELAEQIKKELKQSERHAQASGKAMGRQMRQGVEQELRGLKPTFGNSGAAQAAGRNMGQQMHQGMRQQLGQSFVPRINPNTSSVTRAGHDMGAQMGRAMSQSFSNVAQTLMPNSVTTMGRTATSGLGGLTAGLGAVGLAAGATTAAVAGVALAAGALGVASVKSGIDFTKTLNNMQAVTGATASEMRAVRDEAMALGRDTELSGASAEDAALAMAELAKGGLQVKQSMEAAKGTLQLATAAQIGAGEAATIQTNALNAFGLSADKAGYVSDVLANAANKSSGEMTDFAYGLQAGGSVAQQFGMTVDETVASLAMLAQVGIKGSDAGTLLKSSLLALASPSEPQAAAMDKLGLSIFNATGEFVGMEEMINQLNTASKAMTPEMYAMYTSTALGSDGARLAGVAARFGANGFRDMRTALNEQGSAARVAAAQNQGLPGVVERISNTFSDLKLSLFGLMDGPLQEFGNLFQESFQASVDWLNANKPEIIGFFSQALQAALGFFEGSIRSAAMFQNILSKTLGHVIEGLGKFTKMVGDTLQKLPDWLLPGAQGLGETLSSIGQKADDLADTWQGMGNKMNGVADKVAGARERIAESGEAAQRSAEFVRDLGDAAAEVTEGGGVVIKDNSPELIKRMQDAGFAVEQIPDSKDVTVTAETAEAEQNLQAWLAKHSGKEELLIGGSISLGIKDLQGNPMTFPEVRSLLGGAAGAVTFPGAFAPYNPGAATSPGSTGLIGGAGSGNAGLVGGANGGDVRGGIPGKDSVAAALMPGEHVLTTGDVERLGGQEGVYALRRALKDGTIPGFEDGGAVGGVSEQQKRAIDFAFAQSGKPYDYGGTGSNGDSFDCSGIASSTWAAMVGLPTGQRYFNTESDFAKLGFKPGFKPGALNVGIQRGGGGPNSHMALTLPNGISMESGGSHGSVMYGQNASGALDEQFALHYYFDPTDMGLAAPASQASGDSSGSGTTSTTMSLPDGSTASYDNLTGDPLTDMLTPGKSNTFLNQRGVTPASIGLPGEDYDPTQFSGSGLSEDTGRTEGFIPANAGSTSVSGTSFAASLLNMGAQAVNGVIDSAASAASTAASIGANAAAPGSGGAAGMAAQVGISMATGAAKRGVSYGFQMAGIGVDALIEQLTPFGTPRWLGYDYTQFMPQLSPQSVGVTTGEKAAEVATMPDAPHTGTGVPPGPTMPQPEQPGGPVQPGQLPGAAQPIGPAPEDWTRRLGVYDEGGWLKPGTMALNLSGRPEPVFSSQQWEALKSATEAPAGAQGAANDYSIKIDNVHVSDVGKLKKELDDKQMLQMMRYAGRP